MSLYRTDIKILSIPEYTPFIDGEAAKYDAQWIKDPTKFKYHITLQVTGGLINECPVGIFVNILYVRRTDALKTFNKIQNMFAPINGDWHILLSVIDKHKLNRFVPTKSAHTLEVEVT